MPKLTDSNACAILNNSNYIKTYSTVYHIGAFEVGKKIYTNPDLTSPLPIGTYGIGNNKFTIGLEGVVISTNNCDGDYTSTTTTNVSSTTIYTTNATTLPNIIIVIGYWLSSSRRLVLIPYSTGYFLAETDLDYNYITPRGRNFWYEGEAVTKFISDVQYEQYDPKNSVTGNDGLIFPSNFPNQETIDKGYIRSEDGGGNLIGYGYIKPGWSPFSSTSTAAPTTAAPTTAAPTTAVPSTTVAPTTTTTTTPPVSSTTVPVSSTTSTTTPPVSSTTIAPTTEPPVSSTTVATTSSTTSGGGDPIPISLNSLPNFPKPVGNNNTDWTDFSDFVLPLGILNSGGYGFGLWNNESLNESGKLNLFDKGWTNLGNLPALNRSKWADFISGDWRSSKYYFFQQVFYMIRLAAQDCVTNGKTGGIYGDIASIAAGDPQNPNIDYSGVLIPGAIELGKSMAQWVSNSIDGPWDILVPESIIMLDEESMTSYSWAGGNHYSFLGYITQGMCEATSDQNKIFWYAQPVSRWIHANDFNFYSLTDDQLDGAFQDSNIVFNSEGWNTSKYYVDSNGGYSKTPFPSNVDIYAKDGGGNFIIESGKRKYKTTDSNVSIYGNNVPILTEPHEFIKYCIMNYGTGEQRFGASYFNIDGFGNGTIKSEYVSEGFNLHPLARPNASEWRTEYEYGVENNYKRADGIVGDLLCLNRLDKSVWDLSTVTTKFKLCQVERPKTEPWTSSGNSINSREIGENQSFFDTFCLLYSGGLGLDTWDDGQWLGSLPNKGTILFPDNGTDYFARYQARLSAVQTAYEHLQGTDPANWKFVHFYQPYIGRKYKEVISQGIYYNGKLHAYFYNPSLENNEVQNLQMGAGATLFDFQLTGHEVYYKTFDVSTGLNIQDFTLEYTTIYGRHVKVNGKVTNSRHDHYISIS